MRLPTRWRELQNSDPNLYEIFNEVHKALEDLQGPRLFASMDQSYAASSNRALPVFNNVRIDTAKEYNVQTGLWSPSRVGTYLVTMNIHFNGPANAGDFINYVLYQSTGLALTNAHQLAYFGSAALHWGKHAATTLFPVLNKDVAYRPAVLTGATSTFNLVPGGPNTPDESHFSATYLGELYNGL